MAGLQQGYTLLALIAILAGVGGAWLGIAATEPQGYTVLPLSERQAMLDARQSLLSYSTLYPYLYGPAGAGPAHLPCPDTDGFTRMEANVESGARQRLDGPNPPCSSLQGASGALPRHVVLPGYRYLFHSQPWQRYSYNVSASFVNNPINRITNLPLLQLPGFNAVAFITLTSDSQNQAHLQGHMQAKVVINRRALAPVGAASVAAWVIQRSDDSRRSRREACPPLDQSAETVAVSVSPDVATRCESVFSSSASCRGDKLLVDVLDYPVVVGESCIVQHLALNTIEGVPALRHWFLRNRWHESIALQIDSECEGESSVACSTHYPLASRKAVEHGAAVIKLHRKPLL